MKKLHHTPQHGRAAILNRIIGDYKKYSLNPSGRAGPTGQDALEADEDMESQCESLSDSQPQHDVHS